MTVDTVIFGDIKLLLDLILKLRLVYELLTLLLFENADVLVRYTLESVDYLAVCIMMLPNYVKYNTAPMKTVIMAYVSVDFFIIRVDLLKMIAILSVPTT